MPRKRVVSRTIPVTYAEFMAVDKAAEKIVNEKLALAGVFRSERTVINAIKKQLPENYQFVKLKSTEERKDRYWMPEDRFIELAYPGEPGEEPTFETSE